MSGTVASRLRPPTKLVPTKTSPRIEEVLATLEGVVLDEGFAHLGVEAMASRAKTSRATLYSLAPSKDELILLVLDRIFRRLGREALEGLNKAGTPSQRLRFYVLGGVVVYTKATSHFSGDILTFPAAQRLIDDHFHYATLVLAELIAEGIAQGDLRSVDPYLAASGLLAAMSVAYDPVVLDHVGLGLDEAMSQLGNIVIDGLIK